jgi:hypothetical protein
VDVESPECPPTADIEARVKPSLVNIPKLSSEDVLDKTNEVAVKPSKFKLFEKGSVFMSIFNLIAATLGAGTITLPYLAADNGIVLAAVLIVFGATISYFCGMLLVS